MKPVCGLTCGLLLLVTGAPGSQFWQSFPLESVFGGAGYMIELAGCVTVVSVLKVTTLATTPAILRNSAVVPLPSTTHLLTYAANCAPLATVTAPIGAMF